ncbi:hypothetical protein V1478_012030 [Vespula squamosa]|uniref:Uncharacterized protein n=1 Tax=Vespula squamosa TaxID=30214 RepID=A0ABD2AC19_VESSQ
MKNNDENGLTEIVVDVYLIIRDDIITWFLHSTSSLESNRFKLLRLGESPGERGVTNDILLEMSLAFRINVTHPLLDRVLGRNSAVTTITLDNVRYECR